MTVTDHPAVAAYLARLDALSGHLPAVRREELRADLVEHLADAVPEGANDAQVRAVLDRLGPPEEIVSAETGPDPVAPALQLGSPVHEVLAVAFLTFGSLIPAVGWLVGVVLLWTSGRWTTREKVVGTLLVPGGPFLLVAVTPELFGLMINERALPMVAILPLVTILVDVVLPFVVGGVLLLRAIRRSRP
jgi:hypothetical protein